MTTTVRWRRWLQPITLGLLALLIGIVGYFLRQNSQPPPDYMLVPYWPQQLDDLVLGQVPGAGINAQGQVVLFSRRNKVWLGAGYSPDPIAAPVILTLDSASGTLLKAWGEGLFVMPHGLTIDQADNIWVTDVGRHQVFKFSPTGELLLALGEAGVPGQDAAHFNQPTDVAVAPDGHFYVSDGYANSRIVKFSPDGEFLFAWGNAGTSSGEFDVPHSITLDPHGRLYVADRGNARIQIFDHNGQWLAAWHSRQLGRPWAVRFGADGYLYVIDGGDQRTWLPDRARVLKLDNDGHIVAKFGSYGTAPGQFIWPHALAVGPDGALYIGEVATGQRVQKFLPNP